MLESVHTLAGGAGSWVHISGEAGIGKTSLIALVAEELARHRGVDVRIAAARETDRRRPMSLARALLSETLESTVPDPVGAAIEAVERLAAVAPVALLVDDVHWGDDVSVDVLGAVARRAKTLGVLLVTATRSQPVSPMLGRLEAGLTRYGVRLDPRPLTTADLAELVEHRIGAPPGPALTETLAGTAGNPFLAVELVSSLVDEHRLTVRDSVADLTAEHHATGMAEDLLERLARRALLAVADGDLALRGAAVVPGGVTADELAALLDQSVGAVVTVALRAIDAAVLVDTGSTLTFRHELLRLAILGTTPPTIVRALRRRAGGILIETRAAPERIAACLLAGDDPPDPSEVAQLLKVGRSMKKRNPQIAADLLRRALDGIDVDDPTSIPTTIELGWALSAAGRAREVVPMIQERVTHPTTPLPIELLRLEGVALSLAGRLGEASARYDGMDPARLVEDFDVDDPEVVDAAAELAFLRVTSGRLEEASELIELVERSAAQDSTFRQATVSSVRAWLLGTSGAFEAGAHLARVALRAIAQDDSLAVTSGNPTLALGLFLDGMGDSDGALAVFRGSEASDGPPRWAPPLHQFGASLVLFRRGEWDDALAEAEAGLLAAEETGLGLGAFWPCSVGSLVSCARGQVDEARRWLDRSRAITPPHQMGAEWLLYASALLRETEGRTEQAAATLDTMARAVIAAHAPALLLNCAADLVRLARRTGRTDVASAVADQLDAMTRRTASPVVAAIARWVYGLIAGSAEDIEAAAEQLSAQGRLPEAGRAWHDAAVVAAAHGQTGVARRLATQAFRAYDHLGAEHLHRRLRSELRAHDLVMRPRRAPPRPTQGWDSLTSSEATVVDLAGQGLTNTQIAERLYISRRTVESHLGRVYAKLHLSTRAQLITTIAHRT